MPEDVNAFVFQGGKRKYITLAPTVGDAVTNKSPGVGFRWKILSVLIILDTDGTVADRFIRLSITDGTIFVDHFGGNTNAIPANQIKAIVASNRLGALDSNWAHLDAAGTVSAVISLMNCILEGVDQLRITVNNGVAGDSYSGVITVLEMKL